MAAQALQTVCYSFYTQQAKEAALSFDSGLGKFQDIER